MKRGKYQLNSSVFAAYIALLVCTLFFSCYTTSVVHNSILAGRLTNLYQGRMVNTKDTSLKSNEITSRMDYMAGAEHMNMECEEMAADKYYHATVLFIALRRWLITILLLFIITHFNLFIQFIRGWLIKVSQSRWISKLVHYIQLKDGKVYAQSLCS